MNLEIESRYLDYIENVCKTTYQDTDKRIAVIKLVNFRTKIKESFEQIGKRVIVETDISTVMSSIETSVCNDISDLIIIGQRQAFKIVDKYINKLLKQD